MNYLPWLVLFTCFGCTVNTIGEQAVTSKKTTPVLSAKGLPTETPEPITKDTVVKIAFGSCSNQNKKQILWNDVLIRKPDYWIWLGDNIYGDTKDMKVMRAKYDKQKSDPAYAFLREKVSIQGIWDDHDYGVNDGGKEFSAKKASQQELLDFLDVPEDDPRRQREGIYYTHDLETSGGQVRMIYLDTRYFRDPLNKDISGKNLPNPDGTILGMAQWEWLEKTLRESEADVHIIASSIQVLPEDHVFEKWANFPKDRAKLLNMLVEFDVKNPIFISGDRHMGEYSYLNYQGKDIHEITSSSLTHGWSKRREEFNQHRVGPMVYDENFCLLTLDASLKFATFEYIGDENKSLFHKKLLFK